MMTQGVVRRRFMDNPSTFPGFPSLPMNTPNRSALSVVSVVRPAFNKKNRETFPIGQGYGV